MFLNIFKKCFYSIFIMFILLTFTMAILQPFKTFLSFSAAFNAPQFPFQYIHFLAPFTDCLQNPKETVDFGAAALLCFSSTQSKQQQQRPLLGFPLWLFSLL
uniref:Uncharacterized protein n=1 Tax=Meloidogyne enterolobii TaxID=390850 RepID=A0A6V7WYY3_MELEN|nr:unnamed protein product [Meloidogyne enterolobii]